MLHRPGRGILPWTLQTADGPRALRIESKITCDSGDLLRQLAIAGHGLTFKSAWDIAEDVRADRLVPLLAEIATPEANIHAMYPSRRFLPPGAARPGVRRWGRRRWASASSSSSACSGR